MLVIIKNQQLKVVDNPYQLFQVRFSESWVACRVGTSVARMLPFAGRGGHRLMTKASREGSMIGNPSARAPSIQLAV